MDDDLALPSRLLDAPAYVMLELLRDWRQQGVSRSPETKWRLPSFAVMAALDEFGPASQSEVSRRLRFDPSDLVGIIDALEEAGWVVRGRDDRDRRRHQLRLTDAGRDALAERYEMSEDGVSASLAPLSLEERELFQSMLLRLLAYHQPSRVPR